MSKKLNLVAASGALILTGSLMSVSLSKGSSATSVVAPASYAASLTEDEQSSKLLDETVYVFTDTAGNIKKTISSDWSKNLLDNTDFYSKTEAKIDTPVELKVSYMLDGSAISAADLAGKSGKVTIRFDYENHARSGGYFVPYIVLTGLSLDNTNFSNIEVVNGRVLNDGSRTIVAGVALPGMQENLGLSASEFSIPNYLEITADAKDFKLGTTLSLVSSKLFADLDVDSFDGTVQSLSTALNQLDSSMNQLVAGSTELNNGLTTLDSKTKELVAGIAKLSAGATQLSAGAKQLDAGVSTLENGVESLYDGINTNLVSKNATLKAGAKAIYESALAQAGGDKTKVESIYQFYQGVVAYTNGVAQLNEGVVKGQILAGISGENGLKAGSSALSYGAETLSDNLTLLNGKMPELEDGVTKLEDGSVKLKSGLIAFDEQGINRLINIYNNDVAGLTYRLKTVVNLSKAQKSTKFLYRTDEI